MAVLLCLIYTVISWWLALNHDVINEDFFHYWLGGKMVLAHQDVYSSAAWMAQEHAYHASWIPATIFLYPIALAVLLAPLGILELHTAYAIWTFAGMVGTTVSFLLLLDLWNHPANRIYLVPLFLGLLLYRPLIVILRNGQLGAMLLTILTLTAYLWEKGKWLSGGLLVGLIALKPQFGIPLLVLMGVWLMARKRWAALAGMAVAGLLLAGIGWLQKPDWISVFLSYSSQRIGDTIGQSPTLWGLSRLICNVGALASSSWASAGCLTWLGLGLAGLLAAATLAVLALRGAQIRPALAMSLAICCAVLVTPYLWAYDHILLLIPLLLAAGQMASLKLPFLATGTLLIAASLVCLVLLSVAMIRGTDEFSALFPLLCLGGIGALFRREIWKTASVKRS